MRILFLYPSLISGWASYTEHGNNESSYMDHGFAMLSAVLKRAGHDPFSMDLRSFQNWEHFEQTVKKQLFDFTVVSFFSANEQFARQAVQIVKRNFPDKPIIGGGVHLSVTKTRSYPCIDSIVLGEGEGHILKITDAISRGESLLPVYELEMIKDLDSLPFVDRELFNPRMEQTSPLLAGLPEPFITIVAGRGCWGKCTFCAPSRSLISGDKIRIRSVDHFINELLEVKKQYGLGSVMIHDDLLGSKKWLAEFVEKWECNIGFIPWWCQLRADTIIKMKEFIPELANIGLTYVSVGLESGSQRMLDFLQKGVTVKQNIEACQILHDSGINIFGNYIVGLPTETPEDLEATGKMLEIIKPAFHSASTYTSYPGSHLYNWIEENDYWVEPAEHYSLTRFPYERKIKFVNYDYLRDLGVKWRQQYTGHLRTPVRKPKSYIIPVNALDPLVSVILVTYNRPKMLNEAIQSIFNQTFTDWELIILDYTEDWNKNQVLYDNLKDVKNIHWKRHEANVNNIAYCWNEGLDMIRGQFWCTLDDDNVKYPDYLKNMVTFLEAHPENDAVICPMEHTGQTQGIHFEKPKSYEALRKANSIDSGQVLWRKSIIEKIGMFDERLISMEDWDFMIRTYALNNNSGSAFGWLEGPPLCSYHWHDHKRMYNDDIKAVHKQFIDIIQAKIIKNEMHISFITSGRGQTESQRQLADNVFEAVKSLEFVTITDNNPDVILVMGPLYNFTLQELKDLKSKNPQAQMVGLTCEDPQALHANITYLEHLDWIVTNDMNAYYYYISLEAEQKKKQVLHWNNLSISNKLLEFVQKYEPEKIYDVCFIGYPYPSRIEFLTELIPMLHGLKILLIGDAWEGKQQNFKLKNKTEITVYPTLPEIETAKLAMQSKIVLIKHRDEKDLGGFPIIKPASINRGYIEAAYRSALLIDDARFYDFLEIPNNRYESAQDCAFMIKNNLKNVSDWNWQINDLYIRAISTFTHRARLLKVLNCIRSQRFNKKIG